MKKFLSLMTALIIICSVLVPAPQAFAESAKDRTYTINGVTLPLSDYPIGDKHTNCYTFAAAVYRQIWGSSAASTDIIKNESDKTITEENARKFLTKAAPGANIRVSGSPGHSMILLESDDDGFIVYHGNVGGRIAITYYTYKDFVEMMEYMKYPSFAFITVPDVIRVTVNGESIPFDQPPIIVDGRTLVPVRAIFEALDASVEWDNSTKTVASSRGNTSITLTIGSDIMYKNDAKVTLDVPAQITNSRTLVPARAIAEAYDCTVDWDQASKTVIITK